MTHTPRDWELIWEETHRDGTYEWVGSVIHYETELRRKAKIICEVGNNTRENEENGNLIAAAPAMYEALEDALGGYKAILQEELLPDYDNVTIGRIEIIEQALAATKPVPHEDAGMTAGEQHLAIKEMRENMGPQDNG